MKQITYIIQKIKFWYAIIDGIDAINIFFKYFWNSVLMFVRPCHLQYRCHGLITTVRKSYLGKSYTWKLFDCISKKSIKSINHEAESKESKSFRLNVGWVFVRPSVGQTRVHFDMLSDSQVTKRKRFRVIHLWMDICLSWIIKLSSFIFIQCIYLENKIWHPRSFHYLKNMS